MAIPKYNELYPNVLKVLSDGKEYSTSEIDEIISGQLNLTEEERNEMLPSGNQKLIKNRVGWARAYLKKAGLIESRKRGFANITESGLNEYNNNPNLTEDDLMKYPSFVDFVLNPASSLNSPYPIFNNKSITNFSKKKGLL